EDFDLAGMAFVARPAFDRLLGDLHEAPALRRLARAGVLAARRAVDDEDARGRGGGVMGLLGGPDRGPRGEPIDRQIVVGIGELGAGLAGARRLAAGVVGLPRDVLDRVELRAQRLECKIDKLAQEARAKLLAR